MDFVEMEKLSKKSKINIILDESFLNHRQFGKLRSMSRSTIINLRISKMGGLIRSLIVAKLAKDKGIPIIVGAHVGETSILTRAALTVANCNRGNLIAQEGAFGVNLLEKDAVKKPLMFGAKGLLDVKKQIDPSKYGFQLEYL